MLQIVALLCHLLLLGNTLAGAICPQIGKNSNQKTQLQADDPNGSFDFWEVSGIALSPWQLGPSGEHILSKATGNKLTYAFIFDTTAGAVG